MRDSALPFSPDGQSDDRVIRARDRGNGSATGGHGILEDENKSTPTNVLTFEFTFVRLFDALTNLPLLLPITVKSIPSLEVPNSLPLIWYWLGWTKPQGEVVTASLTGRRRSCRLRNGTCFCHLRLQILCSLRVVSLAILRLSSLDLDILA
ncbi:hypothetical protein Nepgr_028623 [Nepenthes gracilis]|uniref:Uncharacterized protein n=1 Tax=Nepenthes gracilis TaxID=150966 RepID=A0AAD3TAP5_NEPGR|nr:hypothetical protein Nepgr_028623 [Nepenthes gracilis]